MALFDYSVYIMLHFPLADIKYLYHGPHSLPPKKKTVVTLYKLHPESVPSDIYLLPITYEVTEMCV